MATKAWRGEEVHRSTTFEDLQAVVSCSTRLAIMVALSGGPMNASDLQTALGFGLSLLSNHFKVLRETGIVDYASEGRHHVYHLIARVQVTTTSAGLMLHLTADDGSSLSGAIPNTSAVMRVLARAIAASKLPRAEAAASNENGEVRAVRRRRVKKGPAASGDNL